MSKLGQSATSLLGHTGRHLDARRIAEVMGSLTAFYERHLSQEKSTRRPTLDAGEDSNNSIWPGDSDMTASRWPLRSGCMAGRTTHNWFSSASGQGTGSTGGPSGHFLPPNATPSPASPSKVAGFSSSCSGKAQMLSKLCRFHLLKTFFYVFCVLTRLRNVPTTRQ